MKSLDSSAVPDRDSVPENRIGGGSDLLSPPERERSQKGFQLVRKQLGRGRTLWSLPQIQMPEDLADHRRLLDPGDDLHFIELHLGIPKTGVIGKRVGRLSPLRHCVLDLQVGLK